MGGDLGPRITVPAVLQAARSHPDIHFVLIGEEAALASHLPAGVDPRIRLEYAPDTVAMDDKPAYALRHKRRSSLWLAVEMVASGRAQACVSAGNTGALMAMGKYQLNTFPGIDRPAICKPVPTAKGHSYLLDLGANIDCRAEQLLQFAVMGAVLAAAVDDNPAPSIGLLNIGEEEIKGGESVRLAARLLTRHPGLNYVGYTEGDGIYRGDVDVVVCDGFVGNVALKVSEGVARLLAERVSEAFTSTWYSRLAGRIARPVLRKWHTQFDPARYNGASFLGLRGTVIKSHGAADIRSFRFALEAAREQAQRRIPQLINDQVARLQGADPAF